MGFFVLLSFFSILRLILLLVVVLFANFILFFSHSLIPLPSFVKQIRYFFSLFFQSCHFSCTQKLLRAVVIPYIHYIVSLCFFSILLYSSSCQLLLNLLPTKRKFKLQSADQAEKKKKNINKET